MPAPTPRRCLPGEGRPVITGRLGLQAELEGSGLSPASLIGSLSGAGTITLEDAQISGLDPKAFNAAIRAVDQGLAIDAPKIRDIVATVLDGGALAVPRLDAPVAINAGQARIGQTIVYGQGADLSFAAGADLADGSIDARLHAVRSDDHRGIEHDTARNPGDAQGAARARRSGPSTCRRCPAG